MFFFNPYGIPQIIASIIFVIFGIYILRRNYRSNLNRAFFIWCLSAFIWNFTYGLCFSSSSESLSSVLARIGAASVFLLPSAYNYFVANFIGSKKEVKITHCFFAFYSLIAVTILFTDKLITGVYKYYFGFHGKGSFLYLICAILFTIPLIRTAYVLINFLKDKNIELKKRKQARYILISFIIATLATFDYLPKFGIEYYPKGWFFFLIWVGTISYAILAHHLLDINIVIKKGFVYSIAVALITAIYSILVIITGNIFQGLIGHQSFILNLFSIFIIALLFNPLRDIIQHFFDKKYFHGTLESLEQEKERLQQELFQKEKLAYVGQLASSVVHEIKNPLAAIKTHIDYLPQKYSDPDFKEKFQKLIPREIERIDKVLSQLLNLAKPRQVDLKPVNIVELIESTLSLLEDNFTLKKISVKKEYQAIEAIVHGDDEQLRQVFLNLFLNAIQAMNEGGTLTVSVDRKHPLSTNLRSSAFDMRESALKSVFVIIQDNGCGIPEHIIKTLFTPFQTTKKDGIGLGLSITQEIIKLHGGTINVESKLGEGTKFTVELPKVCG